MFIFTGFLSLYKMYNFPMLLPNNAKSQIQFASGEKEGGWILGGN